MRSQFSHHTVKLQLAAVLAAALVLRVYRLLNISMWSDEYHTVRLVRLSLPELAAGRYAGELNPPLYYLLLHLTLDVAGESELAMRLFSLTFAIGALLLYFFLIREMFPHRSTQLAVAGTALMALHPLFIYYATEIRAYSALLFFTLLSLISYYRVQRGSARPVLWSLVLVLSLAACPYLHHFGVLSLLAVATFAGTHLWLRRHPRRQLFALSLVGLAALLYLPGAIHFLFRQANIYPAQSALVEPAQFLQLFTFSLHQPSYETGIFAIAALTTAVGFALLVRDAEERAAGVAIGLVLLLAVAVTLLAYGRGINIVPRYLLHLAPLLFILTVAPIGIGGTHWTGRLVRGLGLVTLVLYGAYAMDFTQHTDEETELVNWKSDWEQVATVIEHLGLTSQPLVLTAWDNSPLQYYVENPAIAFADFEKARAQHPQQAFLLVLSENSAPLTDRWHTVDLYSDPAESLQLLYIPSATGNPASEGAQR
ncbi:MAG: glycosyltransferase family 39 protein [Candidatus Promineifilaceae bacterium]|nr:glycosyltransferase family 39 protein [Candidatus Promineifilaceae bacterium]